jgi:hypothetical protein
VTRDLDGIREQEYLTALDATALRRRAFGPGSTPDLVQRLLRTEQDLRALHSERAALEAKAPTPDRELRGAESTGLTATVTPRLATVPTAVYHLLPPATHPLVTCEVRATKRTDIRRVRVVSFIEGYSARAVDTVEIHPRGTETVHQQPALFADRIRDLTEYTTAALNVAVEDLDGTVELHRTFPIGLLARNAVPMSSWDERTGTTTDLSRHLGAFVTPNAPEVMRFLSDVAAHHPRGELAGCQLDTADVEAQVRAVFEALGAHGLRYVNSLVSLGHDDDLPGQRVRLPRQSLAERQANCIDGTVLVAALLEAMTLSPAVVLVPGHALLGWETWNGNRKWRFLETTLIGRASFEDACAAGGQRADAYRGAPGEDGDSTFRCWPVRELRARHRILPME